MVAVASGGLNKGTLSKLRDAGYAEIGKRFSGNYLNTSAKLTAAGRKAFAEYRKQSARFNRMLGR